MKKLMLQNVILVLTMAAASSVSAHSSLPISQANTVCSYKAVYTINKKKQSSKALYQSSKNKECQRLVALIQEWHNLCAGRNCRQKTALLV